MPSDIIKLIECPRDAWQGIKRQIPTEIKVRYLRALVGAGFKHIDAVSFVSPKAVPQMADSEKVLDQLDPPDDVEIIGVVVNEKGADRAIATGAVTTLGYPSSISETFLRKNQNQSPEKNYAVLKAIKDRAGNAGVDLVVYISMAFGNPYGDQWSEDKVLQAAGTIASLDIHSISLADTVGIAAPERINRLMTAVVRGYSRYDVGIHMHSSRAAAAEKVLAAYDAGCRRFDTALGGLGGCPFAQDALVGNIPTEVLLEALEQRGVLLPIAESLNTVMALNGDIGTKFAES
jgi:hydroxymethylglutaryl-CoA lyase